MRRAYSIAVVIETNRELDQEVDFERINVDHLDDVLAPLGNVEFVSGLYEVDYRPGDYDVAPAGHGARYVGEGR